MATDIAKEVWDHIPHTPRVDEHQRLGLKSWRRADYCWSVTAWRGWELARTILAFSALLYAGIWAQASLFHWAGAFKKLAMWGPVVLTPVVVLAILLAVLDREGVFGWIAAALLAAGVLSGGLGLFYHLKADVAQV